MFFIGLLSLSAFQLQAGMSRCNTDRLSCEVFSTDTVAVFVTLCCCDEHQGDGHTQEEFDS